MCDSNSLKFKTLLFASWVHIQIYSNIEFVSSSELYQLRFNKVTHSGEWQTTVPIDLTLGTPGSDKKASKTETEKYQTETGTEKYQTETETEKYQTETEKYQTETEKYQTGTEKYETETEKYERIISLWRRRCRRPVSGLCAPLLPLLIVSDKNTKYNKYKKNRSTLL